MQFFYRTGSEAAQDFICELQSRIQTYGIKDESNSDLKSQTKSKPKDGQTDKLHQQMDILDQEIDNLDQHIDNLDQHIEKRIHVWIHGNDSGFGSIATYFGPENPKNFAGSFQWSKPITKTRVGLAALIRAISIVLQDKSRASKSKSSDKHETHEVHKKEIETDSKKANDSEIIEETVSLVVHVASKYLFGAIQEWLRVLWTKSYPKDRNRDMYKLFYKQIHGSNLKLLCILETRGSGM
jgi:hypothetical protein